LLEGGGVEDQPAWYVDAMLAMERNIKYEQAKRSEQNKQ